MDDQRDDPKIERPRRIEILTGSGARRRWSETLKAQIVSESLAPGMIVTEVARRYGARASQVHGWRKDAREGRLALPPSALFAPVMIAAPSAERQKPLRAQSARMAMVEIDDGAIRIRVREGADGALVAAIVRALKIGA